MQESDPLRGFNLDDFFEALQQKGSMKAVFTQDSTSLLQTSPEEDTVFQQNLLAFQAKILVDYFNGKTLTRDIDEMARMFRDTFEAGKQQSIAYSNSEEERKYYQKTTIEILAEFANTQFENSNRRTGRLLGSQEEDASRKESDFWAIVQQVVQASAELKEE